MSGIAIKYSLLLNLSVEQLYYQNKLYKRSEPEPLMDFSIRPTVECKLTLNRMGLIFKPNEMMGGFSVYASVDGTNPAGDQLLKTKEKKNDKLTFLLFIRNTSALNFDDLPGGLSGDKIFFFSNQITDAGASRDDLHLSKDLNGVTLSDTIKASSADYRYLHSALVAPNTAKVRHVMTGAEIKPKSMENIGGRTELVFDLSLFPDGKCILYIQNASTEEFYYMKDITTQSVFGVIELSLSDAIAENYRIIEMDQSIISHRPLYKIKLLNRKTRWRYMIQLTPVSPLYLEINALNPADKADFLNRINIITNDNGVTFTPKTMTDSLFVFETDRLLLLQEKYLSSSSLAHDALKLSLKKNIGIAPRDVKPDLPFPDAANLDASNYPNVYSIIFVTI